MKLITTYLIGLIFGVGISISGMANPAKVLNFFDILGHWDPALIFVMGGALVTTFIGYRLVFGHAMPLYALAFDLPTLRKIDAKLIGGSAVFGIGWGLSGFCPGGALPALGTGKWQALAFVTAMMVGITLARFLQSRAPNQTIGELR